MAALFKRRVPLCFVYLLQLANKVDGWSCDSEGTSLVKSVALTTVDHLAMTNDASPAYYYKSEGRETDKIIVMLGSGSQCWDSASCLRRYNGTAYPYEVCEKSECLYMSSKHFPQECQKNGLFDRTLMKNPFRNWTLVYVPYASSDAFMGNASFDGFEFRGRAIVFAVLTHLSQKADSLSRLVLAGESAGALGAMAWLDDVNTFFQPNVFVQGLLDSPLYLDFPGSPLMHFSQKAFQSFHLEKYKQTWMDTFGQYALPRVQTPFFLLASQFDSYQLAEAIFNTESIQVDNDNGLELTPERMDSALLFANRTRTFLLDHLAQNEYNSTFFSIACWSHAPTLDAQQFVQQKALDNTTLMDAINTYFSAFSSQSVAKVKYTIDECLGFQCGSCGTTHLSWWQNISTPAPASRLDSALTSGERSISLHRKSTIALAADFLLAVALLLLVIALALMAISVPHPKCCHSKDESSAASYTPVHTNTSTNDALVENHLEIAPRSTRLDSLTSEDDLGLQPHPHDEHTRIGFDPPSPALSRDRQEDRKKLQGVDEAADAGHQKITTL